LAGSGPLTVRGAAWGGEHPIAKVDVSTDSGRTWKPARLTGDKTQYGWQAGSHVLMARATDTSGNTQPFLQDWNPSGYQWNVVHAVRVEAGAEKPGAPVEAKTAIPDFPAKAKAQCLGCHESDIVAGQRLTRPQWEREVDKMVRWGANVKPDDRTELLDFLVKHFGR
jgi:hypothetical protein